MQNSSHWIMTHISPTTKHEKTNHYEDEVQKKARNASDASFLDPAGTVIGVSHPHVGGAPEDEAEKGVEEGAHQRQEVGKERDDLSDDESDDPGHGQDTSPRSPAEDCMVSLVARPFENSEEDEAG